MTDLSERLNVEGDAWAVLMPGMTAWFPAAFVDLLDESSYLRLGARATRKVSS